MTVLIVHINSSRSSFITEFMSLKRLFEKQLLCSVKFICEIVTGFNLFVSKELEFFELATLVTNFTTLSIDCESGIVFGACFIIGHHSVAIFERVDLVIHSTVVSLAVTEVVELLAELCNELIFFALADFDARGV